MLFQGFRINFLKRFLSVFSHHTDYVFVREKHDMKTVQILAGVFIACTIQLSNEQSNAKSAVTYMTRVKYRNQKHIRKSVIMIRC